MPDTRKLRGAHPKDRACFASEALPALRAAVADLSWLRSRGYSDRAALALVGNRYRLRDRQRKALQRCAAADSQIEMRRRSRVDAEKLTGESLLIDGYNVILTLETALSGGVLLLARDGVMRDLAAMSRHYRRVQVTRSAIDLLAEFLDKKGCAQVHVLLDRPVSNSGRLRDTILATVSDRSTAWIVDLTRRTDRILIESSDIVATADSAILDRCSRWFNLSRSVIEDKIPQAWVLDFSQPVSIPGGAIS